MKKITFSLIAALGVTTAAFAGHEVAGKGYKETVVPCFNDRELQVDLFGSYTDGVRRSPYSDGFGGGIGVNYFFMRYLGVGIDGNVYDGGHNGVWNLGGRLIARYPLELGSVCLSPYAFAGGGAQFDGLTSGTWLAGGGLEWRATPKFGIFGEGHYTWAGNQANSAQARVGVRFVF